MNVVVGSVVEEVAVIVSSARQPGCCVISATSATIQAPRPGDRSRIAVALVRMGCHTTLTLDKVSRRRPLGRQGLGPNRVCNLRIRSDDMKIKRSYVAEKVNIKKQRWKSKLLLVQRSCVANRMKNAKSVTLVQS